MYPNLFEFLMCRAFRFNLPKVFLHDQSIALFFTNIAQGKNKTAIRAKGLLRKIRRTIKYFKQKTGELVIYCV